MSDNTEKHLYNMAKACKAENNIDGFIKYLRELCEHYLMLMRRTRDTAELKLFSDKFDKVKSILEEAVKTAPKSPQVPASSKPGGSGAGGGGDNKDGLTSFYAVSKPEMKFKDVAGMEDVKAEITRRVIAPYKDPDKAKKYDIQTGGGMIFYGPPGTGKTTVVKPLAGEVDAKL